MKLSKMNSLSIISGIYKINYPNGKIYIGQAQNIRSRLMEHNQRARNINSFRKIQLCEQAMRKYNYQIEEFELLEQINSLELLDERESYWINYYNSANRDIGYNLLPSGNVAGKRGIENSNACFDEKQLNQIIDLLSNDKEKSIIDIANQFNVSVATILKISYGKTYFNPNLLYPLRRHNHNSSQKNNILDYFESEDLLIELKEELLYRWDLEIEKDLAIKYNIPINIIREINQGQKFGNIGNYSYPIRKKNIRNNHNFSINDIKNILNDLRETNLSQTKIGEKYGINRATVSRINCGNAYIIKNYNYPAR